MTASAIQNFLLDILRQIRILHVETGWWVGQTVSEMIEAPALILTEAYGADLPAELVSAVTDNLNFIKPSSDTLVFEFTESGGVNRDTP